MQMSPGCLTPSRITQAVETALRGRFITDLSVALVDDATIARLHQDYMQDSSPTDVLTFDLRDDVDGERIEGEIVVSVETAQRQAGEYERPIEEEILRYVVHGALHLAGMDDDTEKGVQAMRREEDRILRACEANKDSGKGGRR